MPERNGANSISHIYSMRVKQWSGSDRIGSDMSWSLVFSLWQHITVQQMAAFLSSMLGYSCNHKSTLPSKYSTLRWPVDPHAPSKKISCKRELLMIYVSWYELIVNPSCSVPGSAQSSAQHLNRWITSCSPAQIMHHAALCDAELYKLWKDNF